MQEDEDDDECRYSCVLVSSAFTQLVLYLAAVGSTIHALQEGSIFKVFEIEEALLITFFQIFSLSFGACALVSLMEKAWKGSYGYGDLFATKLKSILTGISSLGFLFFAGLFGAYRWEFFQFHGLYFLLDGITCLIFSIVYLRRFQLINEFVHDLLHANGMHWIPISEQNARDLYKLQESERAMRAYINSTRFGPFHRHAKAFRHSEFYQLHKWIAQIERYVCSPEPKESIMALVREMNERAKMLKIDTDDQERYMQLAALPFILMPVTPTKHALSEFEEEV